MRNRVWRFYLLGSLPCLLGMTYDNTSPRFRSPQGHFEIAIEPADPDYSLNPDQAKPTAGLKAVHYKISFYRPGSRTAPVALTDYYEIRTGSRETVPRPLAELVRLMLWSPQEDFVVLPKEDWPSDRKQVPRRIVSLKLDTPWQTSHFDLADTLLAWSDPVTVAGNRQAGCKLDVAQFNGREGTWTTLSDASLPAGYVMVSSSKNSIVMKKVIGPCAKPEEAKAFKSECTVYNLSFNRREMGSCPP